MIIPSVSAICPTYGRTKLLEESIESFLRQDFSGLMELVILNDLPEQTLELAESYPSIRVVNLKERCRNLGEKRNAAAVFAKGELLITWSDDDIHLPWRISENVRSYMDGAYVSEGSHFFHDGRSIHFKNGGLAGPFLMSRKDYWNGCGIPDCDSGEDQLFLSKIKSRVRVVKTMVPSYVYRWGTGHYHISGYGRDKGEWEKVRANTQSRLDSGKEPSGVVRLVPHWKDPFQDMANAALIGRIEVAA